MIKILIADDSVVFRSQLKMALESESQFEIIGVASNGKIAVSKVEQLKPDWLIIDIEMPELDGIEAIKAINEKNIKVNTIVFSSKSLASASKALEAMSMGAIDFVAKPGEGEIQDPSQIATFIRENVSRKILNISSKNIFKSTENIYTSQTKETENNSENLTSKYKYINAKNFNPQAIVIASSTGGPNIIEHIFLAIKLPLTIPILIAQHMPPIFTLSFAERLSRISGHKFVEAKNNDVIQNNTVYIAPGDYHLTVSRSSTKFITQLNQNPQVNSVRPSADVLFQSAADCFGVTLMGIILTGMGTDGCQGAISLKKAGGCVVVQNKESCIVAGMTGSVVSESAYDTIATPDEISSIISNISQRNGY